MVKVTKSCIFIFINFILNNFTSSNKLFTLSLWIQHVHMLYKYKEHDFFPFILF